MTKSEIEELDDWARDHCETCGERREDCDELSKGTTR